MPKGHKEKRHMFVLRGETLLKGHEKEIYEQFQRLLGPAANLHKISVRRPVSVSVWPR